MIIVLNKIDKVDQQILEDVSKLEKEFNDAEIWTVSALKNFNVENLRKVIKLLPQGLNIFLTNNGPINQEVFC